MYQHPSKFLFIIYLPLNISTRNLSRIVPDHPGWLHWAVSISKKPGNIDWGRSFTCHWDELMTFEVSCADGNPSLGVTHGCSLSWWQDEVDDNPTQGLSIYENYDGR